MHWNELAAAVHLANLHSHHTDINTTPNGRILSSTPDGVVLPGSGHSSAHGSFSNNKPPSKWPGWNASHAADGDKEGMGSLPMLSSMHDDISPDGSEEHIGTFQDPDFSVGGAPERTMSGEQLAHVPGFPRLACLLC